jgi:hypothetical protein
VLVVSLFLCTVLPTQAAAMPLLILPTDDDRGLDALLDGNFVCCQMDRGQATVTLTTFEECAALDTAELHGYTGDGVITAADLTLNNLLTTFRSVRRARW